MAAFGAVVAIIAGGSASYYVIRLTTHNAQSESPAAAMVKLPSRLANKPRIHEAMKEIGARVNANTGRRVAHGPASGPLSEQDLKSYASMTTKRVKEYDKNAARDLPALMDVIYGDTDGLREVMDAGLNPNVKIPFFRIGGFEDDTTLLNVAIATGQRGVIRELVESGANVNAASMNAPLVQAAGSGKNDVVKYLLNHGANINQENGIGHTAVDEALRSGQESTVEILRARGARMPYVGE